MIQQIRAKPKRAAILSLAAVNHLFAPKLAVHKRRPDALWVPNLFHVGARPGLVHAKHIATIAIEKS